MKQMYLNLTMLVAVVLTSVTAMAAEPYAVLSSDNTTLTFYYDNMKANRGGMGVGPFSSYEERGWNNAKEKITTVEFDASFANCTSITSTRSWFRDLSKLTKITNLKNLNTSNTTDMSSMFDSCYDLKEIDVSSFNTANVTNMYDMFSLCYKVEKITGLWCFNTSKVENMIYMFYGCHRLKSLDLSSFNTYAVTKMYGMFGECYSLKTIYVRDGWSTKSLVDYFTGSNDLFSGCTNLVGGKGTTYDESHIDYTYAHVDGGPSNPGYLTYLEGFDLTVGGTVVTSFNKSDVLGNGTVSFDGDHTLTLRNARITGDEGIVTEDMDLDIVFSGTNSINVTSNALRLGGRDDNYLDASEANASLSLYSQQGSGIYISQGAYLIVGSSYKSPTPSIIVTAPKPIDGAGMGGLNLDAPVYLTLRNTSGGKNATVQGIKDFDLSETVITSPNGAYGQAGSIYYNGSKYTGDVIFTPIDEELTTYNLFVAGINVNSANLHDVLGDGTVSYSPNRRMLTLNNATINVGDGAAEKRMGIAFSGPLTIKLEGHNVINAKYVGIGDYFKATNTKLDILGPGSLDITVEGAEDGIGIDFTMAPCDLTFFDCTVNVSSEEGFALNGYNRIDGSYTTDVVVSKASVTMQRGNNNNATVWRIGSWKTFSTVRNFSAKFEQEYGTFTNMNGNRFYGKIWYEAMPWTFRVMGSDISADYYSFDGGYYEYDTQTLVLDEMDNWSDAPLIEWRVYDEEQESQPLTVWVETDCTFHRNGSQTSDEPMPCIVMGGMPYNDDPEYYTFTDMKISGDGQLKMTGNVGIQVEEGASLVIDDADLDIQATVGLMGVKKSGYQDLITEIRNSDILIRRSGVKNALDKLTTICTYPNDEDLYMEVWLQDCYFSQHYDFNDSYELVDASNSSRNKVFGPVVITRTSKAIDISTAIGSQHLTPNTRHPTPVYDLQGRRVADSQDGTAIECLQKGIYVVDGKKTVVK